MDEAPAEKKLALIQHC